jgi:hypothetical protein
MARLGDAFRLWCANNGARAHSTKGDAYLDQRTGDGVALGLADGGVLRGDKAGEKGNDGGVGEHVGCWWCIIGLRRESE